MNPFFADELWIYLLRLCPPASYFPLISTCKRLYFIGTSTRFFPNIDNIRRARPKRYLVRSPKLARNIDEVFRITDEIIRDAAGFAHDLHTCFNESINSSRTKDLPKDTSFPSTVEGRAVLAVNRINQGPGQARANAWHELGLLPTRLQAALWHAEDQRAKKDRIRQSLKAFKQRSRELSKKRSCEAEEEKRISKQRTDSYNKKGKKTALAPRIVCLLLHFTP